jgi:hypothetical protein
LVWSGLFNSELNRKFLLEPLSILAWRCCQNHSIHKAVTYFTQFFFTGKLIIVYFTFSDCLVYFLINRIEIKSSHHIASNSQYCKVISHLVFAIKVSPMFCMYVFVECVDVVQQLSYLLILGSRVVLSELLMCYQCLKVNWTSSLTCSVHCQRSVHYSTLRYNHRVRFLF